MTMSDEMKTGIVFFWLLTVVMATAIAYVFGIQRGEDLTEALLKENGLEIKTTPEKREIVRIEQPKQ